MSLVMWVIVALVVAILAAVGGYAIVQKRRRGLRERFGPEYERTLNERADRGVAEQELRAREQRFDTLDIKPLDPQSRQGYAKAWTEVQERFVDAPSEAVNEADQLVSAVMAERGYPTEDYEQQLSDLSVTHGPTLDHYRQAHAISGRAARDEATTEDLRQAMQHYRALFDDLLVGADDADGHGTR
ncbi:hypothetical protein [Nonomuraea sp. NEAU-A123]|uniref:hypothetical protein n=1 Tax=Nonomuraea sp. NEAU-A123 TaxID=2839649 RepID=UPI001BE47121|nr:hypothetical protein [Nonomuraea sp. NEAU-A123]MBT2225015.1 hypothetical protein [Nonomuraea sp. NEAU-A123]